MKKQLRRRNLKQFLFETVYGQATVSRISKDKTLLKRVWIWNEEEDTFTDHLWIDKKLEEYLNKEICFTGEVYYYQSGRGYSYSILIKEVKELYENKEGNNLTGICKYQRYQNTVGSSQGES